jgi:threonine/homoserine/homoserine lactone efflux protein
MLNLTTILQSIFIGISIAVIPGPIFFELTRRTLARGFWDGALLSIGEFLGNFLLLCLIFFGVFQFFTYALVKGALYLCGSVILLYIGYVALKLKSQEVELSYKMTQQKRESIFTGFLIAITSPIVIAFWVSLSGSYLAEFRSAFSAFQAIFFIAFGFVIFFFFLAGIISLTRKKIPTKYVVVFSRIFGIILCGYGLLFIYRLATTIY